MNTMQHRYSHQALLSLAIFATLLCSSLFYGCIRNTPPSEYPDKLLSAISQDSKQEVSRALQSEPRLVNVALITGRTPIYHAILYDYLLSAEALLEAGADPSQLTRGIYSNSVDSPLNLAVRLCRMDLVEMLLNDKTFHFFSERDLADAAAERKWQSGCSSTDSDSISQYIKLFLDRE